MTSSINSSSSTVHDDRSDISRCSNTTSAPNQESPNAITTPTPATPSTDYTSPRRRKIQRSWTFDEEDEEYDERTRLHCNRTPRGVLRQHLKLDGKRRRTSNKSSSSSSTKVAAMMMKMTTMDEGPEEDQEEEVEDEEGYSSSSSGSMIRCDTIDADDTNELLMFTPPHAGRNWWTMATKSTSTTHQGGLSFLPDDDLLEGSVVPVPCLKMRLDNNSNPFHNDLFVVTSTEKTHIVTDNADGSGLHRQDDQSNIAFRLEQRRKLIVNDGRSGFGSSNSNGSFMSLPNYYLSPNSVVPQTPITSTPPPRLPDMFLLNSNRNGISGIINQNHDTLNTDNSTLATSFFVDGNDGDGTDFCSIPHSLSLPKLPGMVLSLDDTCATGEQQEQAPNHSMSATATLHIQMRPHHYGFHHHLY